MLTFQVNTESRSLLGAANLLFVAKEGGSGGVRQPTLPDDIWERVYPFIRDGVGVGRPLQVKQVAQRVGVSSPSVSAWVNNKARPTLPNLVTCLEMLGQDPRVLLPEYFGRGESSPPWAQLARDAGEDPSDPVVAEVYETSFQGALGMIGEFAKRELARRRALEKGKAVTDSREAEDGEF